MLIYVYHTVVTKRKVYKEKIMFNTKMGALISLLKDEKLAYVIKNFSKETIKHPYITAKETTKFLTHWLAGTTEKPKEGLAFETHGHSHFSDGPELSDIIDLLFDSRISILSITDHGHSNAFDNLQSGKYRPCKKYDLEVSDDKRSLVISSEDHELVVLRSIEYLTDKGEIGIHGYAGILPRNGIPLEESIQRANDMGGFVVINHPYFWSGIGYHGKEVVEKAIQAGAVAIEKNSTEIPPQVYSAIRAELDAKEFGVPVVAGGDSHELDMYGLSGIIFEENVYNVNFQESRNNADTVKALVSSGTFSTFFNYVTAPQFLRFFKKQ